MRFSSRADACVIERLLGAAALLAVLAPAAAAAATPRVTGTSHAPLVLAAGDRIAVTAKVVETGKRVVIGLVFGSAKGSARHGLRLGPGIKVSGRGTKRVVIRGRVPATVKRGLLGTLLVCVNPAQAVKGKGTCRRAARIATSGTSAEERIAGARRTGRLSRANAVLFGVLALRGDKRVPSELRGGLGGPNGEEAAIKAAGNSYPSLPSAVKRQVLPFFVPPPGQGTAWSTPGRKTRSRGRHAAASRAATLDCKGYAKLDRGYFNGNLYPWRGVPTADGKAIVWYQANAAFPQIAAQDQATARRYAREMPKIWKKLTKEFGPPLSDANEPCYHGPDGRYDVYVDDTVVDIESGGLFRANGIVALTIPYLANGTGTSCSHRPSWITIRNDQPNFVLAHEFMHALQFSHRTADCKGAIAWWTEGSANWAGDFVYPDDNTERKFPLLVADPLGAELVKLDYDAWPFWMMLQRTLGTGALRSVFAQLKTKPSVPAVNAAISGGYAKQIPRFYLSVWNQTPVGNASFAIPKSFVAWDKWNQTPAAPPAVTLKFDAATANQLLLPLQRTDGFPALSVGAYHRVDIPDPKIKQITFTNDLAGKPGAHVDAMLHLADGSWKLANWTGKKTVTLCRTRAAENVQDMVIVSTNTSTHPLAPFYHTLLAGNTCPLPLHYTGTWTRIVKQPSLGSWTEEIHGTAAFRRPSYGGPLPWPQFLDSQTQIPYQLVSASATWTVSGELRVDGTGGDYCLTTYSGGGTGSVSANPSGSSSEFGIEDISGREQPPTPTPEPKPFYYSIDVIGSSPDSGAYQAHTHCVYAGHASDGDETDHASEDYLHIGYATTYPTAPTPPDYLLKSAAATPLSGHHFDPGQNPGDPTYDDTWSFTGSG